LFAAKSRHRVFKRAAFVAKSGVFSRGIRCLLFAPSGKN
jgi:hypothetical protein